MLEFFTAVVETSSKKPIQHMKGVQDSFHSEFGVILFGGNFRYSISSPDDLSIDGLFAIDAATGQITVIGTYL